MVSGIDTWLKDSHAQIGNPCPFKSSNQLLRFTRKHGSANNFYPATFTYMRFNKHEM